MVPEEDNNGEKQGNLPLRALIFYVRTRRVRAL